MYQILLCLEFSFLGKVTEMAVAEKLQALLDFLYVSALCQK